MRERVIYTALRPHLTDVKWALDFCCGYSPLSPYLLMHGIEVCGFDTDKPAIKSLREVFPNGNWSISSYDKYEIEKADLLIWLGMEEPDAAPWFVQLVASTQPTIVLLEYATGLSKGEVTLGMVAKQLVGRYEIVGVNQTSFGFAQRFPFEFASRTFVIYRIK